MTHILELEAAFASLSEAVAQSDDMRVVGMTRGTWGGRALIGLDPSNRRHLLFPVASTESVRPDRRSAGIQIGGRVLTEDGDDRAFVDISCLHSHLNHVFTVLAGEILVELQPDDERPDLVASRVLDRWRELLSRPSRARALSRSELAGLFGELLLVEALSLIRSDAVMTWAGPLGGRHDFVSARVDLEVKTTVAQAGRVVEIHGIEQLLAAPGTDLALVFVRLEEVVTGGRALGSLVSDLLGMGSPSIPLYDRLTSAGASAFDLGLEGPQFRLTEEQTFLVTDDFPRLTSADLRNWPVRGITYVRYGLDLSAAMPPLDHQAAQGIKYRLLEAGDDGFVTSI